MSSRFSNQAGINQFQLRIGHSRQQRGQEDAGAFLSSANQLSGKSLKLAAKKAGDQGAVWSNVASVQGKLSAKMGASVCQNPSPTSFELTMDSEKVKAATKQHIDKLQDIARGQHDVIGYAFAINGKINSADVYASNDLFNKLWPKLLKSAAAEAISETDSKKSVAPKAADVKQFLADAENKPAVHKAGNHQYRMTEQESSSSVMYSTNWSMPQPRQAQITDDKAVLRDYAPAVHTNYISK